MSLVNDASPVYLDANASEPMRPGVLFAMTDAFQVTGNPSSIHAMGRKCYHLVEDVRENISHHFGGDVQNCIFTSGGTEADIMAVYGQVDKRPLWIGATEHPAIARIDLPKKILPVDQKGLLDLVFLEQSLQQAETPPLVCVMLANNETGVIHPIKKISALCHQYGALLHIDAVQAAGRLPINFKDLGGHSMALSAHKMGGPKGVGVLLLASGNIRGAKSLNPLFIGGGQEQGRRGGTLAMPNIVGMGTAVKEACSEDRTHVLAMRVELEKEIKKIGGIIVGEQAPRLDNTSCIIFNGITAQRQLMALDMAGFYVSTGSACSSGKVAQSEVLLAMGLGDFAKYAIRVSLPWNVTQDQVERFIVAYRQYIGR